MAAPFTFWTDPGHGWLEVPMQLLRELDVLARVSGYSYQSRDGRTAYLEEDCDAGLVVEALKARGDGFACTERYADRIFIRELPRFPARR